MAQFQVPTRPGPTAALIIMERWGGEVAPPHYNQQHPQQQHKAPWGGNINYLLFWGVSTSKYGDPRSNSVRNSANICHCPGGGSRRPLHNLLPQGILTLGQLRGGIVQGEAGNINQHISDRETSVGHICDRGSQTHHSTVGGAEAQPLVFKTLKLGWSDH